ncbi:uncharacterized protein LOC133744408 [Rosa rugosa]|uniref:uncharacterized protein LOC133744408 n=1 Tax=Rosa rugosa TaxID=74645 RepID=UPI002B406786|nr:uncharacterized protein LOC133744408 [Rosa rugosa]
MQGFREALGYADLLDLGFSGTKSTWWNADTKLRLDRAVCTPSWFDIFGYAKLVHLPPSDSDHSPILLHASTIPLPQRTRIHRFKFEAFWLQHHECDPLVKQAWHTDVTGVPLFRVATKIKHTRNALDKWQKAAFCERQQSMLGIRARLEELLDARVGNDIQEEKKGLMKRRQNLLSQEEVFWKQRSKITWLREGDRNTGFFHRKVSNRRRKNLIKGLFDDDGEWKEDDAGLEKVVSDYFQKMFTASELDLEALATTLSAINPCVTPAMNAQLCRLYSGEEIKYALF